MSEPPGQDAAETATDPLHFSPEAGWTPATPDTDVEELLRRRVPVRVRVAQAMTLLVVMTVAAGLVIHSLPVAATPTPGPLGPVLLLSNVSFGTVTLNGAPLAGSPPLVATFRRGLNSITLTAPPFRPRTCHVQWPGRQSDGGCDLGQIWGPGQPQSVGGRPVSPVLIVEMPFGLEDLPRAAQSQALAATTDSLQSVPPRTSVLAGEYIATGQDTSGAVVSQRTDMPLQAELLAAATRLGYSGDVFCGDPGCAPGVPIGNTTGQPKWVATANVTIRWQFRSSSGVVASSAPWSAWLPESLPLTYDAQQGWTVDQDGTEQLAGFGLPLALVQTACYGDIGVLSRAAQRQGDTVLTPVSQNPLEGCEFGLQTAQGANAGHFVWRFGVLLAADGPAHALLPALPLAPASELAAVGG
jgi:hypothetical protein